MPCLFQTVSKQPGGQFLVKSISECPPGAKTQRQSLKKGRKTGEASVSLLVKQTRGDSGGQGSLVSCSSRGHKASDTTE